MDLVTLLLIFLLLAFLIGGWQWPAPTDGRGFPFGGLLYLLAFVVILIVILRLLRVAL